MMKLIAMVLLLSMGASASASQSSCGFLKGFYSNMFLPGNQRPGAYISINDNCVASIKFSNGKTVLYSVNESTASSNRLSGTDEFELISLDQSSASRILVHDFSRFEAGISCVMLDGRSALRSVDCR